MYSLGELFSDIAILVVIYYLGLELREIKNKIK